MTGGSSVGGIGRESIEGGLQPGARPPPGGLVARLSHAYGSVEPFPHRCHDRHGMLPTILGIADQLPPQGTDVVTVTVRVLQAVTGDGEMMNRSECLAVNELEGQEVIERVTT